MKRSGISILLFATLLTANIAAQTVHGLTRMVADQKSYQVEVRTAEGGCSPPESLKPTPIWDDWDRMGG